ncbi:hypothetical protein BJX76DRAFT_358619 [Aspergillus varians]
MSSFGAGSRHFSFGIQHWRSPRCTGLSFELEGTGDPCEDERLGEHRMTLRWTRKLYDRYVRERNRTDKGTTSIWPLVLDADDIMTDPGLVSNYGRLLGLDLFRISRSWMPISKVQRAGMDIFTKRYLSTLLASEGIVEDKIAGHVDIEKEAGEWCSEFDERAGRRIKRLVWESMPDYEFLKARRLRAGLCSKDCRYAGIDLSTQGDRGLDTGCYMERDS